MPGRTRRSPKERRNLRAALIRRDGNRCAYCRTPFTDPAVVCTIDHVAPYCLYRTWRREAVVLACLPCNHAKADRIPLLLALHLARYAVTPHVTAPTLSLPVWLLLARHATAHASGQPHPDQLKPTTANASTRMNSTVNTTAAAVNTAPAADRSADASVNTLVNTDANARTRMNAPVNTGPGVTRAVTQVSRVHANHPTAQADATGEAA